MLYHRVMTTVSPELIKPIVMKYQEEAVNTVLSSSLPEDVKRDLVEELKNYWFNVDRVADYLNFIISLVEKFGVHAIPFSPFIEESETYKRYERLYEEIFENDRVLLELIEVVLRLDKLAQYMYYTIFKKLGYKVERDREDLWVLIVRKPES